MCGSTNRTRGIFGWIHHDKHFKESRNHVMMHQGYTNQNEWFSHGADTEVLDTKLDTEFLVLDVNPTQVRSSVPELTISLP